ncbi:MAG: metallophosphoesterase [Gammaproteobacteria bacterium]|nr:metallophosphoesterase [Gammaproteobacteria bacterium]
MKFIDELFDGSLDIIGDVHGEIDALNSLLDKLGYAADGSHPDTRRLVFLGDLTDRGPDSPAVLKRVMALVAAGHAQLILGNHELNLLRDDPKHGNNWWVEPGTPNEYPAESVRRQDKARMRDFLATLPIALERDDLRIVHACWNNEAITQLRSRAVKDLSVLTLYKSYVDEIDQRWTNGPLGEALSREWRAHGRRLTDRDWTPVYMPAKAEVDRDYQMRNPLRVATSGEERETDTPFWAGGKWRMVERVKWWENYDEPTPVIIGHYWRRFSQARTVFSDKYGPDLFAGIKPHQWMGKRKNVYCVDFSVGGRYAQRAEQKSEQLCSLAAVRVPEWEVMHDSGECWKIEDGFRKH